MMEQTHEALEALRAMVVNAKAVPMSSSCMVSRQDALALIGTVTQSLATESAEADSVAAGREQQLAGARAEAEKILHEARQRADMMVMETMVYAEALERSEAMAQEAANEADAIRREADSYVDGRIAELEAGLARTMTQIQTMRARLSERSRLDERFAEAD